VAAETAKYTPEIREFVIYSNILTSYANLKLPANAEKQYEFIYSKEGMDIISQVKEHIDTNQLYEIDEAIDARIWHEVKMIETVLAAKTNEMMMRIEAMVEQFEAVFGGISGDSLNSVMKKFSEMDTMTEESIAKAVLGVQRDEAAANSDEVVPFPGAKN